MANVKHNLDLWLNAKGNLLKEMERLSKETKQLQNDMKRLPDAVKPLQNQINQNIKRFKQLENQVKSFNRVIKDGIQQEDKENKKTFRDKYRKQEEYHKVKMDNIKAEANAEKEAIKQAQAAERQKNNEAKQAEQERIRNQKELERLARQRAREEKQQQQELLRQDRERLQVYKELGSMMKSAGSAISGLGTSMIGTGLGTAGAITGASNKYVDTFIDLDRALAIKASSGELGSTTIPQWNNLAMGASKQYGLGLSDVNQYLEMSLNATSPYYAAANLDLFSRLGYVTGASGESLGIMNSIYGNKLNRYGWSDINQFGDALIAYSDIGGAGIDEMLESYSRVLNYTGNFDKYDKYFTMKVMSSISRMLPGSQGLTTAETAVRQLLSADAIKKDLGAVTRQMASAHGLSLDEYGKQYLGVNLNGNNLYSQEDLFRSDYIKILAGTFKDIMNMEGASLKKNEKTGEVELITSKEIQSDLIKNIAANTRSLTAIYALIEAIENGTWDKVNATFTDENIAGKLDASEKELDKSPTGKLKKALNSLSVSFMQLISRFAPLMVGFMEKLVEWTDWLGEMDFETLVEQGRQLADVMATLVGLGIGLFVVGKVISMFGNLITWTSNLTYLMTQMNTAGVILTGNTGKLFNWLSGSITKSTSLTGQSLATFGVGALGVAGKMTVLAGEIAVLGAAVVWLTNLIKDLQVFGSSQEFLQGKEDAINGKDTPLADAYNRTLGKEGTSLTSLIGAISQGDWWSAGAYLAASGLNLSNFIPGGKGSYSNMKDVESGDTSMQDLWWTPDSELTTQQKIEKYWTGATNLGDLLTSYMNGRDMAYLQQEHKGNYVEPGLKDAESYFNKEEDSDLNNFLKELEALKDAFATSDFNPDVTYDNYDINDLQGLIEDGTAKGTEKGVKNALQGHFNTPDTYSILGQVGLGQLNQYEGFGIKKQGNQTVVNNNNVSIHVDGGNPDEVRKVIEELFGGTGALSGATSYAYN